MRDDLPRPSSLRAVVVMLEFVFVFMIPVVLTIVGLWALGVR